MTVYGVVMPFSVSGRRFMTALVGRGSLGNCSEGGGQSRLDCRARNRMSPRAKISPISAMRRGGHLVWESVRNRSSARRFVIITVDSKSQARRVCPRRGHPAHQQLVFCILT